MLYIIENNVFQNVEVTHMTEKKNKSIADLCAIECQLPQCERNHDCQSAQYTKITKLPVCFNKA